MRGIRPGIAGFAAIATLLVGCGTSTPSSGKQSSGKQSSGKQSSGKLAVTARSASSPPPAGNQTQALAFCQRLLSGLVMPSGALPARVASVPALLRDMSGEGTPNVHLDRLYAVRQPAARVYAFLQAHPPKVPGLVDNGGGPATPITPFHLDYILQDVPTGISSADVNLEVAPGSSGTMLIAVYAHVTWLPGRSTAEWLNFGNFRQVTVSVAVNNWGTSQLHGPRTFTSAAVIARLADLLNRTPAAPQLELFGPPFDVYQLSFTGPGVPEADVQTEDQASMRITVGGRAQPSLEDSSALAQMVRQLLGMPLRDRGLGS